MNHEAFQFKNVSADQFFTLTLGGAYTATLKATWGGGSVKLQKLAADAVTYVDLKAAFDNAGTEQDDVVGTFVADGDKSFVLSPGSYKFTVTTATAVYAAIARAPLA